MTALIPFYDGCEDCPQETLEINLLLAWCELVLRMEAIFRND